MQKQATPGKRAFVTGASYGLGAATALTLARDGYAVGVAEIRLEMLSEVVSKIEAMGGTVVPVALDLRSQESIEKAAGAVIGGLGGLDVLVNNAGVTMRKQALEVTPDDWNSIMSVNLTGTFFMTQQVARHLVAEKRPGCIVNIASTHGVVGFPERIMYGTSKAALMHMSKMLAIEWAKYGIRINCVAPGTVETESRAVMLKDPDHREKMLARIPLGRFPVPEEIGAAVRYLASPEASYITGQTLVVDGGVTIA
jgi:NAD(P)-dependent dehydrogenase (short-subunit alcohol dehydrogenase family)